MRIKTIALAILALMGSGSAWATPRGLSKIKAIASEALHARHAVEVMAERENVVLVGHEREGFVVVSRDASQPAVLGVCREGGVGEMNPALQWWMEAIDRAMGTTRRVLKPASLGFPESVEPLVTTKWGQDAPFNNLCPVGPDGTHCLTGCVATSTAQLMNYHQLPVRGQGSSMVYYPYGDATGTPVTVRFGATWFDWSHMRDTYAPGTYTDEEADAVAQLMVAAGVSADMMYGTDAQGGSGASSPQACQNLGRYFGFADVRYMDRANYSEEQWMQMVYEQLSAYGPIVYDGDDQRGGHSFIIDGYREDGLVHVNWGYSGNGDGYYDIATLKPSFSSGGYTNGQDMMLVRVANDERVSTLDLTDLQLADGLLPAKAYYGYPYLTDIVLPKGITQWGDGALGACPSLRSVTLPAAEGRQFVVVDDVLICSLDTTQLVAVLSTATGRLVLPPTVTTIHAHALDGCVGIDTLVLPASVNRIEAEALRGCAGLKQLQVRAKTPPTLGGYNTFAGIWFDQCSLSVPSGSKVTYGRKAQWKEFTEVDEFGTTITATNHVRKRGEPNPQFGYVVSGKPVSGIPVLYTDATQWSPAGVYPIYVLPGTITDEDVDYVNGRLIVEENDDLETVTLGYCDDALSPQANALGTNDGNSAQVAAAIHIPRAKAMHYQGCAIGKIRFAVADGLQNVQVFIRTSLTSSSKVVQSVPTVTAGWNEVTLTHPYVIDGEEFYIGYSATQPANVAGILSYGTGDEHTSWLAVDNQWADYHEKLGILYIQAVCEGQLFDRDMAVVGFSADKRYYGADEVLTVQGEVENVGRTAVSGCSIRLYVDDRQQETTVESDAVLQTEQTTSFAHQWALSGFAEGRHQATAIVEAADDNRRNDTLRTDFYVYASTYPRTMLLEHFTSLNCVNCPPVDHMLEEAVSKRTDVAWVTHRVGYRDDEFTLEESRPLTRFGVAGNPYVMIDRTTFDGETPAFTIGNYTADYVNDVIFDYAASMPAFVQLQASASVDDSQLSISVSGESKDFIPVVYPRATLHIFLVEDQVQAEGIQAGDTNKKIHDNILRAFVTPQRGVLPGWDDAARFAYATTTTTDPSWNTDHLRVVAFVVAPAESGSSYPTGPVLNAVQTAVSQTDAIRQPTVETAACWHTVDGRRVAAPLKKGLYISRGKKMIINK